MKWRFLTVIPVILLNAVSVPEIRAQDTVVLKNGRRADCRILDFTTDAVRISWKPDAAGPLQNRDVPLADVDYVELGPLPGEAEARAQAVKVSRSDPLLPFWAKRVAWLGRPRSDAGELGLTYAELLTREPTTDRLERALKVYQQIESGDWSAERRGRAQAGRLRVMLRQGRTGEVKPLATNLLEKTGDPRVLIELRHVLAEAAAASLTQLEKDHPRWKDEDEVVPEHDRLLNEALDGYLFPHLFYGTEEDLAARGLWAAVQLSLAQGQAAQGSDWAVDLTKLYAASPQSVAAAALLVEQPAALRSKPVGATATAAADSESGSESKNPDKAEESGESAEDGHASGSQPRPKPKPKRKSRESSKSKAGKSSAAVEGAPHE